MHGSFSKVFAALRCHVGSSVPVTSGSGGTYPILTVHSICELLRSLLCSPRPSLTRVFSYALLSATWTGHIPTPLPPARLPDHDNLTQLSSSVVHSCLAWMKPGHRTLRHWAVSQSPVVLLRLQGMDCKSLDCFAAEAQLVTSLCFGRDART